VRIPPTGIESWSRSAVLAAAIMRCDGRRPLSAPLLAAGSAHHSAERGEEQVVAGRPDADTIIPLGQRPVLLEDRPRLSFLRRPRPINASWIARSSTAFQPLFPDVSACPGGKYFNAALVGVGGAAPVAASCARLFFLLRRWRPVRWARKARCGDAVRGTSENGIQTPVLKLRPLRRRAGACCGSACPPFQNYCTAFPMNEAPRCSARNPALPKPHRCFAQRPFCQAPPRGPSQFITLLPLCLALHQRRHPPRRPGPCRRSGAGVAASNPLLNTTPLVLLPLLSICLCRRPSLPAPPSLPFPAEPRWWTDAW